MDAKEAREYTRRNAQPCPNCGTALLVAIDAVLDPTEPIKALQLAGAKIGIYRAEEAEEEMRNATVHRRLDPLEVRRP